MSSIASYEKLEELGRIRLSPRFFMRDFLHSEIASWHGFRNVPDHPERAIAVGRMLCGQLLEPLQATFGRIHIRSGYRSPQVNDFGNKNKLNCASNESNYAAHIWDYPDKDGKSGATACIVVPWLIDHISNGGHWTDMAWWIHDNLPYSSLYFFPKLAAFNINWHEVPQRRIDSYAPPKGCLTRPGMGNHAGSHKDQYERFPMLADGVKGSAKAILPQLPAVASAGPNLPPVRLLPVEPPLKASEPPKADTPPMPLDRDARAASSGVIHYRAIHTKTLWRKVNSHRSLEAAINGKDGAAALFARRVRINYQTHGEPLYVLVWEAGASSGCVVKADQSAPTGIRQATVPVAALVGYESRGQASPRELEQFF